MEIATTNKQLSSFLLDKKDANIDTIVEYIMELYDFSKMSDYYKDSLKSKLNRDFILTFNKKFKHSIYSKERFLKMNASWLDSFFTFSYTVPKESTRKTYTEASKSTKKRRINEVLDSIPASDLLEACNKIIRVSDGNNSELNASSNSFEKEDASILSPDEALALFLDAKLTKHQYSIIRNTLILKKKNVFPEYRHIYKAKTNYCPSFDVTETSASTKLQFVLDHSVSRILKIESVKKLILETNKTDLELITKYGCDGTSGFSQYKQIFSESKNIEGSSVFIMCMVPLLLRFTQRRSNEIMSWENKNPSSTRLCRPVKFTYKKETQELIKLEMDDLQHQFRKLIPTTVLLDGRDNN